MSVRAHRHRRANLVPWLAALLLLGSDIASAKVDRSLHEPVPEHVYQQAAASTRRGTGLARPDTKPGGGESGAAPGAPSSGGAVGQGDNRTPQDRDHRFTIDRDTRRPEVLPYSDPFDPSVAPFKRLNAYARINDAYVLSEGEGAATTLQPQALEPGDLSFRATFELQTNAGVPIRLPTPGPGARLIALSAKRPNGEPATVHVRSDSAENWDLLAADSGPITLQVQIAVASDAFGGDFGDPSWESMPEVEPLSARLRESARIVTKQIGVSRSQPVRQVVQRLVAYFRAFEETDAPLPPGADIYLDLALSQKGVCRHRAFAFLITAHSLGIAARMVTNEAHAWVEVYNGERFKRIDLGGAGGALEESVRPPAPTPPDPFAWPASAARGADLAAKAQDPSPSARPSSGQPGGTSHGGPSTATAAGPSPASSAPEPTTADPVEEESGATERAEATITLATSAVKRGSSLQLRGSVSTKGASCEGGSVRFFLYGHHGQALPIGALPTRGDGSFDGALSVPHDLPTGDFVIRGQTHCPRAESR